VLNSGHHVRELSIKSKQSINYFECEVADLSHKSLVIAMVAFLISIVALIAVLFFSSNFIQAINPVAALTATTVALIGMVWFKRSTH